MNTQRDIPSPSFSQKNVKPETGLNRRNFLRGAAGLVAVGAAGGMPSIARADASEDEYYVAQNGNINHSVVHWCYEPMSVEELAYNASKMGIKSVELIGPEHWDTLKKYGLVNAISPSHLFVRGLNNKEHHPECLEALRKSIDLTSDAGFPNVITFSGKSRGIPSDVGLENTVEGIKQVIGQAEKKNVNICIEMLNSRVAVPMKGHPDYMCDTIEWAVELCERVGSPRMKILFDVYHVQIMQGDVITRIKQFSQHIGHYHTAGNPGRNEIDDSQEINYGPIMKAIVETGYQGYVGHEFIPTRNKMAALNEGVRICDV